VCNSARKEAKGRLIVKGDENCGGSKEETPKKKCTRRMHPEI
jgi:hypothetical protein